MVSLTHNAMHLRGVWRYHETLIVVFHVIGSQRSRCYSCS